MILGADFLKWLYVFKVPFGSSYPTPRGNPNAILATNASSDPAWVTALPSGTTASTPTANANVANKAYVDLVASGLSPAPSVYAASTANLPGYVYANGASGVGATLTAPTMGAFTGYDGTTPPIGARVLYKNDTTYSGTANGIYVVTTSNALAQTVLTRATNYDTPVEMNATGLIPVINGTQNANTGWLKTTTVVTIGTTPLTYIQFGNVGTVTSVALVMPTGFSVAGSPITGAGTFTVTATGGETGTGPLVFAESPALITPNLGIPSFLTLTNADGLNLATGVIGDLPVGNLAGGVGASALTYFRGDGSWATPPLGVTSVGLTSPGGIFGVTGSPVTNAGDLGLTVTGISGGLPYFSSTSQLSSSAALTLNEILLGGGAGAPPTTLLAIEYAGLVTDSDGFPYYTQMLQPTLIPIDGISLELNTTPAYGVYLDPVVTQSGARTNVVFEVNGQLCMAVCASSSQISFYLWRDNNWANVNNFSSGGTTCFGLRYFTDGVGHFLTVSNTGSNNIVTFILDTSLFTWTQLGSAVATGTSPRGIEYALISGVGYLIVCNGTAASIQLYVWTGGTAWVASGSPIAVGNTPINVRKFIAGSPATNFIAVANSATSSNSVTILRFTGSTYVVASTTTVGAAPFSTQYFLDSANGNYISVANQNDANVTTYAFNTTTYALTLVSTTDAIGALLRLLSYQYIDSISYLCLPAQSGQQVAFYTWDVATTSWIEQHIFSIPASGPWGSFPFTYNDINYITVTYTSSLQVSTYRFMQDGVLQIADGDNGYMWANTSGASGPALPISYSNYLDAVLSAQQGTIIYRDVDGWTNLAPGNSGEFLETLGTGDNLQWASVPSPSSVSNLTGGVLGSVPYQSAPNTTAFIAPNTAATLKVLTQTGSGSAGALPTWLQAVSTATNSSIVLRDSSGNFSANTITAALVGNATTATSATSATTATTATNATNVATNQVSASASFFPLLAASSVNGNQAVNLSTLFSINANTGILSISGILASGSTNPIIRSIYMGAQSTTSGAATQNIQDDGTGLLSQNRLGSFSFLSAYDTSHTYAIGAAMRAFATQDWSASANGTQLQFLVTANNSATQTTALTLNQDSSATFASTLAAIGATFSGLTASQVVITNGSKTLASLGYSSTATASFLAQWDANATLQAVMYNIGLTATASAGGTTTLTAASNEIQELTGSLAQTYVLPDATTLKVGAKYKLIKNLTSSAVTMTVNTSGGSLLYTAASTNDIATVVLTNNSTAAGTWDIVERGSSANNASTYVMRSTTGGISVSTMTANIILTSTANGASAGNFRLASADTVAWRNNANSANLTLSKNSSDVFNLQSSLTLGASGGILGSLGLIGSTSGQVNINIQAAAGSYNYNLPITAGSLSDVLTSAGGGASAMTWTPAVVTATASAISKRDANANILYNNVVSGYQAIASAAGNTVLTVATPYCTDFTGGLVQTATLPVTSTLFLGYELEIRNHSSGAVTVNSSGANMLAALTTLQMITAKCIAITGTGTASWSWYVTTLGG